MIRLPSIQTTARLLLKHVRVRGTATYEYRTYGDPDGPNYHLIQHLFQEMQREEVSGANAYKLRAFARAIKSINELDFPLREVHQIEKVSGVGQGIARRIVEFIGPSRKDFRVLNFRSKTELLKSRAMDELQRINGIGPIKARALVESGCMSVEQLHEDRFLKMLPKAIQASVTYEKDMGARVTREQAEAFMAAMRKVIPPEIEPHLMGSYRRGHPNSADVDVLLFHPSYTTMPNPPTSTPTPQTGRHSSQHFFESIASPPPTLLQDMVTMPLTRNGIIVTSLSGGPSRWQGLVKIQLQNVDVVRKADIYLMPQVSKAAAFLAFTGDKLFNLDCQKRAKVKGMHLNGFGLWRQKLQDIPPDPAIYYERSSREYDKHSSVDENTQWELVETPDEAALFLELGIGYIAPERRNLANLSMARKEDAKNSTKKLAKQTLPSYKKLRPTSP